MTESTPIQLGFALPVHNSSHDDESNASDCNPELGHRSPHWSDWDGGIIGGRQSWLNPRDLPASPLRCHGPCRKETTGGLAMRFITQLYCPADDATDNEAAFHRSLYVFACPTCFSSLPPNKEHEKDGASNVSTTHFSECVRVLRCQLPKNNDFYPSKGGGDAGEDWDKHTSEYWANATNNEKLNLCEVCGQRGKGKCPKQQKWFCGAHHQKECLRASKQQEKLGDSNQVDIKFLPSICYESELVVEEEPIADIIATQEGTASDSKSENAMFPSKDITDDDADLEQSDLNALTGCDSLAQAATGVSDPTTLAFYARMAIGGKDNDVRDQCLRYCRWPEMSEGEESNAAAQEADEEEEEQDGIPLWLSSDNLPPTKPTLEPIDDSDTASFPPKCQYCGAPRAFEFQIMPQMLHYLLQSPDDSTDKNDENKARQVLTESERAILLEAKMKIESGMDLPDGFREQHEAAVGNARNALLGISNKDNNKALEGGTKEGLDWGTIAVYTCTASCGDGGVINEENGAYMEEAAWMQPPLD